MTADTSFQAIRRGQQAGFRRHGSKPEPTFSRRLAPAITAWLPGLRAGRLEPLRVKAVFPEPGGHRGRGHAE